MGESVVVGANGVTVAVATDGHRFPRGLGVFEKREQALSLQVIGKR